MAEHFVRNNFDSTYCNLLNIKLRHRYFSATKFSEQASLNHLQEHIILLMSKSEHVLVRIVYKKADMWYIKWQLVTTSVTTSDNEWQRVTTNDNEWYSKWQRVTTSSTMSDNEWYNEWQQVEQRMKANESDFRFQDEEIMQLKTTIYSAMSFSNYNVKQNICWSSHRSCSIKKLLLAILQYSQENTWRPAILLKRDSNICVFLWTLQNF